MPSPLITPAELEALLEEGRPVRLLDVRWRLDEPEGRPAYLDGHLPGAVYVDLDGELAQRGGDPRDGRHPLPSIQRLQAAARRWGLRHGDTVVVYDDVHSVAAARAWWVLTRSGVADVRVLDGGLRAWLVAGGHLYTGDVQPRPGTIVLHEITAGLAGIDDVEDWPSSGILLDVRAPDRYRGETEPMDPVGGHIPGAVNLPTTLHLEAGRFREPEAIRGAFASVGVREGIPTAAYCGSGIAACHTALAGAIAGIDVTVYPGSWSQWSNSRGRPVATGASPANEVVPV
jgi:thiosulfate/3-mercaptopyruvate sulfurtransferase